MPVLLSIGQPSIRRLRSPKPCTRRSAPARLFCRQGQVKSARRYRNIEQRRRVQQRQDRDEEKQRQAAYRRQGLRPGDLVCPTCGTGNDPDRQFCRIDATALHEAEVVQITSWRRRLFPFSASSRTQRERRRRDSGQVVSRGQGRKKARMAYRRFLSIFGKLRRLLALLAFVGIVAVVLVPSLRVDASDRAGDAYDRLREWFGYSPQDPINAIDANASSAVDPVPFERCRPENGSLRPEDALRDGKAFTYWAEGVDGPGLDTIIEFEFQSRIDLNSIGIFSGPGTCPEADFLANPRPRSVELRYLRDDGFGLEEIGSDTLKLVDTADFQTFEVEGKDFDRLVLVILSVYDSDQGSATAIAEVEFFGKLG